MVKKFLSVLCMLAFWMPLPSNADNLEEYLLNQILADQFLTDSYEKYYRAYMVVDDGSGDVSVYDKEEIELLVNETMASVSDMEVQRLRIFSRSDTDYFTSATFEYDWSAKIGNTDLAGTVTGHTVLMNTEDGWVTIFDASTQ